MAAMQENLEGDVLQQYCDEHAECQPLAIPSTYPGRVNTV